MATNPDPNPDSPPTGPSEAPDQLSPQQAPGRENVENPSPGEPASALKGSDQIAEFEKNLPDYLKESGLSDGVSGTAGDVKVQDDLAR